MNKDTIKGKMKDMKGRVERQAGEWTGDTESQIKGAGDQAEGKIQQGVGKVKDAAKDLGRKAEREGSDIEHRDERERKVA
jgi:CsbD-like.